MSQRLEVMKTFKLYINGAFPRSESGRSIKIPGADGEVRAHVCQGSKKDLRDAVRAARGAADKWSARSAYNRGQILYRMGEMLEGKSREMEEALAEGIEIANRESSGKKKASGAVSAAAKRAAKKEVEASVDRLVGFAGWADKYAQVLGCNNPVNGPFYNFTVPEGTGVCVVIAPDEPALLGLVSLMAPALAGGCSIVALGSELNPIPTSIFGEVCQTSDVPAGVVNLLTGYCEELAPWIAEHRDVDAIHAANLSDDSTKVLRMGAAENIKRVTVRDLEDAEWYDSDECESPWWIEPFVEMKTIWHPSGV